MNIMIKHLQYIVISLILLVSCDYLDVKPAGKVIPDEVFEFRALLTTAYGTFPQYKRLLTIRSDEVFPSPYGLTYESNFDLATWNDENPDPVTPIYPWESMYKILFYCNTIIEDINEAKVDDPEESPQQLLAEAYCLRAYVHFELLNLYSVPYNATTAKTDRGIPMALKVDIGQEFVPASVEDVYTQIFKDLQEAEKFMQVKEQPENLRYRFSIKSLKSLEARVRLYHSEWDGALKAAEEILPECQLEDILTSEVKPWTNKSKESILALEQFSHIDIISDMDILPNVSEKFNMEQTEDKYKDARSEKYIKSSYSGIIAMKGNGKDEKCTFRSAEIYLIAAEAAARQGNNIETAKKYLLELLKYRLLPEYYDERKTAIRDMNQEQLIGEIMDERIRELITEGHRWYDLRRTTRPEIIKNYMDAEFNEHSVKLEKDDPKYTIPLPKEAIQNNPNLK